MSDVQITVDLSYPADLVWRALTERPLMGEWFLPTDLAPVAGGVYRVFPPPGTPGFTAPFDVDVLEVVAPQRILQLWQGEQLHTEMLWEITPTDDGCHLRVVQSGFLGLAGESRRGELLELYETLFQQRLPAVLERLAGTDSAARPAASARVSRSQPAHAAPRRAPWWRLREHHRLRLLSVAGAAVLTVLIATALATLVFRPHLGPGDAMPPGFSVISGRQPAGATASPTPSPRTTPSPSPSAVDRPATPQPTALTATYRTAESYSLSYIGTVSIKAGPSAVDGWTAVLDLPPGASVTSAWDQIRHTSDGQRVTFTSSVHQRIDAEATFTFSFQVGDDASGHRKPLSCTVNGVPCSGF